MADFTLDTSGAVEIQPMTETDGSIRVYWSDLSPFAQGYVEALFAGGVVASPELLEARGHLRPWSFADLSPEALAMILGDCERWLALYPMTDRIAAKGANMWRYRQEQMVERPDFPPLTVFLNDEGKVCLKVRADG